MVMVKNGVSWRPESYQVFNVTSAIQTRAGYLQYAIVSEHENLYDLWEALTEDGSIYAAKLHFDRDQAGGAPWRIKAVTPVIIGKPGVVAIDPPYFRTDPEEIAAALVDFDWGMNRDEAEGE